MLQLAPTTPAGRSIAIDGRTPLDLVPPLGLLRVVEGSVNLFAELLDETGAPTGRRRCVATLVAGEAVPLPETLPQGLRLVAVGMGEAKVDLLGRDERDAATADEIDGPLASLLEAAAHGESAGAGWTVSPGLDEVVDTARQVIAPRTAWVDVVRTTEEGEIPDATLGDLHPVSPASALEVAAGSRLVVHSTGGAVAARGWGLIDRWAGRLYGEIGRDMAEQARGSEVRARERRSRDRALIGGALSRLPALMDGRAHAGPGRMVRDVHPLLIALSGLFEAERIAVELPGGFDATDDVQGDLKALLRRLGLRSRRITLPDDWWRKDTTSFIGFLDEDDTPVAVIRRASARYEIVLPSGDMRRLDRDDARRLAPMAHVVYRPLPYRPLKAMDLVRHVLATPARHDMRWAFVAAMTAALLGLLTPVITGVIMNEAVPFAETTRLSHLAIGLVMVALGSALFQLVRSIALLRIGSFSDAGLQAAVWDRLLRLPLTFFRRYETGDLMIKAMAPTQLRQALADTAANSALAALFSIVNFGLMLAYDVTLAFAALGFTVVAGGLLLGLSLWQLRFERTLLQADGAVSSFVLQLLYGIQKIRLAGAENRAYARWLGKFAHQRLQRYRAATLANVVVTLNVVLPLLANLVFFSVMGFGTQEISVGSFIAFSVAFGQFQAAMLGMVGALSTSLAAVPLYENMKPILEEQPEVEPDRREPGLLTGRLALNDVCFRYHEDGPLVLDRIGLQIEPGQFVALVGPSGSGKSTIFRLLLGFETPESGTITYDGRDLGRLDLKAVRRQLGVVLQRGTLLPGSIRENIVGSSSLGEEEAWEAARMAGLDEDIRQMPMGMHTMLSEGGGAISGGQRQRLMIARAVVRRPRILLMDEATSALDNRTQAIVAASLERMNATRVVIAHRLSTVIHADCIYVVDGGRIVQQGTYDELVDQPGVFQRIARRQLT